MRLTINLLAWVTIAFTFQADAQEKGLVTDFETIVSKAETYERYKVISREELTSFKRSLQDSLSTQALNLANYSDQIDLLSQRVELLNDQLNRSEYSLKESESKNQKIGFLGMQIKKEFYHAMVWSIVALLSLFMVGLIVRVKHACAVAHRIRDAHSRILEEYRTQRYAATEKQMKLKRELQTALNQLEVLKEVEQSV